MEFNQSGLLEELLLAQSNGGYPWTPFHGGGFPNSITFDQEMNSNSSFSELVNSSKESTIRFPYCEQPLIQNFADPEMGLSTFMEEYVLPPFPIQEDFEGMEENVQICQFGVSTSVNDLGCKVEGEQIGEHGAEEDKFKKSKIKKVGAQPSKNLMAERRRRKRLNDRLSMLRSIVPKISKMDRTAIVGDTIDYMKELLDKIGKLRDEKDITHKNMICGTKFDDLTMPNQSLLRNNPKFDVKRTKEDTRIELCCNAKPGMLVSTLGTLETLGLDVQQCVISCFNDFTLQASCSEVPAHQGIISPEDIKQALFRNAGYGGRCL